VIFNRSKFKINLIIFIIDNNIELIMSTTDASTLVVINRIVNNSKDFYKILNVSKDSTDSDIKKGNIYYY